jgi:hypothetical protein
LQGRGVRLYLFFLLIPLSLLSYDISNLYDDRYWHTLLHFKDGKSEIDDKKFFLSKDGKTDSKAELKATIDALLRDKNQTFCRFPARSRWILEKLPTLKDKIGEYSCKEIDKLIDDFKPKSISLIFPTAHINSPASMYGHSFLRVDNDKKTPLISQAINYAAQTEETNGLLFAYYGLTGGYKGIYSITPYYNKIKEYNDMERRDIWEYELNLDEDEIRRLLYHQFELKDIYSDYFFFTENCSYNLLWLLQSARDDKSLVDKFSYKAIPIDTIRVIKDEGFIKSRKFRPSKSRKIKEIVKKIDNKKIAKSFLEDYNMTLLQKIDDKQKAYILDLSSEMLRYKRAKNKLDKKEYVKKLMGVLGARSKIDIKSDYPIKEPSYPLSGHKTSRVELYGSDEEFSFSYKPSFHDIYDLDVGYQEGAYIDFFDLMLEKKRDKSLKIKKFDIVNITSLSPWDELFKPLSWSLSFGYGRDYKDDDGFVLDGGVGISLEKFGFLTYLFVKPAFYMRRDSLVSISPKIGFLKNYKNIKIGASIKREYMSDGEDIGHNEAFFTFGFKKDIALNLKYSKIEKNDLVGVSLFFYF